MATYPALGVLLVNDQAWVVLGTLTQPVSAFQLEESPGSTGHLREGVWGH